MTIPGATGSAQSTIPWLDLRLRRRVDLFRDDLAARAADPLRGLVITDADVDEILAALSGGKGDDRLDATSADRLARLDRLARWFDLEPIDLEIILVCLAPEVDLRYERLYAYLQDDVTRKRPTGALVLQLLAQDGNSEVAGRDALGLGGRLSRAGLIARPDPATLAAALLARPLRLDERVAAFLLGSDQVDGRVAPFATLVPSRGAPADAFAWPGLDRELARVLARGSDVPDWASPGDWPVAEPDGRGPSATGSSNAVGIVYLHGRSLGAVRALARAAASRLGRPLLRIDVPGLLEADENGDGFDLVGREALFQGAILTLDGIDDLVNDTTPSTPARSAFRELLRWYPGVVLLLGWARWEPAAWLPGASALRIELPAASRTDRAELWRQHLDGAVPDDEIAELAARYRLDDDAVRSIVASAQLRAVWRGDGVVRTDDVWAAARVAAAPPLAGLAQRVEPRYRWDDIVLPSDSVAQLREICDRARHQLLVLEVWGYGQKHARRAGLTALFAGQPGTGKTMAAEIVAADLGLELYRIDLAAVVSKYVGETEKNLERIFRAADHGDAVLLFDEADAIFGKRSEVRDAHDRYANVETAYLLQRLESYDGLAILTTNLRANIDDAFVRRLDFAIEFPMPEEAERLRIWRLALPAGVPLAEDVDLPFLARRFRLAGGHIRNIALAAAFLAAPAGGPLGMKHLVRATRREHQKIGKLVGEADFEGYFPLLKDD